MPLLTSLARVLRPAPWRLSLLHADPSHRVILITQGQGRALHDAQRRGIGPGQMIHIPAGTSFALEPGPNLTGHLLYVEANGTLAWPDEPLLLRANDMLDQPLLLATLEALQREQSTKQPFRDDAINAHLMLISVWLRRQIAIQPTPPRPAAAQRLLTRFLALLEMLHTTGATMAVYADTLDVTPTHLSRVAKSTLGRSAADLVVERSLHAARYMLEDTRKPAKDIADALGFGSAAYFSRFIAKHTGMSPRRLRAEAKERQHSA